MRQSLPATHENRKIAHSLLLPLLPQKRTADPLMMWLSPQGTGDVRFESFLNIRRRFRTGNAPPVCVTAWDVITHPRIHAIVLRLPEKYIPDKNAARRATEFCMIQGIRYALTPNHLVTTPPHLFSRDFHPSTSIHYEYTRYTYQILNTTEQKGQQRRQYSNIWNSRG